MRRGIVFEGAVSLGALLQVVANLGLVLRLAVCVGANGHLAVESILSAGCCTRHPGVAAGLAAADADGPCGCTDVPLIQPQAARRAPDERGVEAASVAVALPAPAVGALRVSNAGVEPRGPMLPRPDLLARRFVVFLV
jgi:hypothetical protein